MPPPSCRAAPRAPVGRCTPAATARTRIRSIKPSRKSSSASSAQCRSSTTNTTGLLAAAASRNIRQPANDSSNPPASPLVSTPMSGPSCRRAQTASTPVSPTASIASSSLALVVAASSDSRIPACCLRISATGQNATPSPYESTRPSRQAVSSGAASTWARNSSTRRLLPIPGTPTIVTSCTDSLGPAAARAHPAAAALSACGPLAPSFRATAAGTLERGSSATQQASGFALPFATTGRAVRRRSPAQLPRTSPRQRAPRPPAPADCNLARGVHAVADTIPSPSSGRAPIATSASPVLTPTAHGGPGQLPHLVADREPGSHRPLRVVLLRRGRSEHGHRRVADELLDRSAEALQDLPQPRLIGSNVPRTSSTSSRSARLVNPTRSANSTVTTLRSSRRSTGRQQGRRAVHAEPRSVRVLAPQLAHVSTRTIVFLAAPNPNLKPSGHEFRRGGRLTRKMPSTGGRDQRG